MAAKNPYPNQLFAVFTTEPYERKTEWMSWPDAKIAYDNVDPSVDCVVRSSFEDAVSRANYVRF